jgi:hypothetical protein
VHAVHAGVLSLYLTVPLDPAELRGLPARADDLIAAAESAAGGCGHVAQEDRSSVREKLEIGGRDWLGRTVAMFACANAGLSEAFPLPCRLPDRAVLGIRPHIRRSWPPCSNAPPTGSRWWTGGTPGCSTSPTMRPNP